MKGYLTCVLGVPNTHYWVYPNKVCAALSFFGGRSCMSEYMRKLYLRQLAQSSRV